jgi:ABC-type amino acid transport substrate-binding protein
MFIAIITISGFTASITSSLKIELLTAAQGPDDLKIARVGTVARSSSEEFLREERIAPNVYKDLPMALSQLAEGNLDAVVYDLPLLAYYLSRGVADSGITVLPQSVTVQHYAFAVPSNSALREPLNRLIPEYIATDRWRQLAEQY